MPVTDSNTPGAPAKNGRSNLMMRVLAALVLVPLAIAAAYIGGNLWLVLVTVTAIGLFAEWLVMTGGAKPVPLGAGILTLVIIAVALALGHLGAALIGGVVGLLAVAAFSVGILRLWSPIGFVYAALALIASVLVRNANGGFAALLFVFIVVWTTDILGYFAGRGIGGPKLWVRVSPNKTWAGAIGGFLGSLIVAGGFIAVGFGPPLCLLALAALLSVVSQLGDLFESAVKRRFGVKDSSHVIPGHGGLLDRLDGFVAAIVAAALIDFVRGGASLIGPGLLNW
jgi:phosphatidate cytidylyltransferase